VTRLPPDMFSADSSESGRNLEHARSMAAIWSSSTRWAAPSAPGAVTSTEQKVPSARVVRPATDGTAGRGRVIDDVAGAEGFISPGGSGRAVRLRQPPDFEPLVVVCEGVGLGAGGVGGAVTVGFGVALWVEGTGAGFALDVVRFGVVWCLGACRFELLLGDGVGLALPALPVADGDGLGVGVLACEVVVAAGAEWLNRPVIPTAPAALSRVARQVSVESLRSPSSRRKVSRCLCRIAVNEIGNCVKRPPRAVQGDADIGGRGYNRTSSTLRRTLTDVWSVLPSLSTICGYRPPHSTDAMKSRSAGTSRG
jgi:hypothetical protein